MKILIDFATGFCVGLGDQPQWPYDVPSGLDFNSENFNRWKCNDLNDLTNPLVWMLTDPLPPNPSEQKMNDITFGNSLLLEFLTGQKDIALDNATYRAMSDVFKYAESALRRGDIPQAKIELTAIDPAPPVWTAEAKAYFISKIDQYLT